MNIKRLKDQHDEIRHIASTMAQVFRQEPQDKAKRLSQLLSRLAGKLKMHLIAEDEFLYPQLLAASDETKQIAQAFVDEMGSLGQVFGNYHQRWATTAEIEGAYEDFKSESRGVFAALSERIKRENAELYPLL